MKKSFFILFLILLFGNTSVQASPGRTDDNGCHHCWKNCEKYGLEEGDYHTHVNGESVPCPFPDTDSSPNNGYYNNEQNSNTYDRYDSFKNDIENIKDKYHNDWVNENTYEKDNKLLNKFNDVCNFIYDNFFICLAGGLILLFILTFIFSELKEYIELNIIRKDFQRNKHKYINKNNPYDKTVVKNEDDYIKYKLEYNKRHKNK